MSTAFPARFLGVDAARARFGASVDRFGALLRVGDPLADEVVDAFGTLPPGRGRALLDRLLEGGVEAVPDAPAPLRALGEELARVPAWIDEEALDRGGELLFRAGWFGGLSLGTSLVLGYASPGGNKPLVASGRLTEHAARRLVETSRFVEAVTAPGGMRPGGAGLAITVKVRIMHAHVRRMLQRSGRWDEDAWGVPINQHDMAGTAILFSFAVVEALRKLGFRFDALEVHRYMQLWRYANHVIGVSSEVLPTSEHEAERFAAIIRATEAPPDDDARALSRAFFGSTRGADLTPAERRRIERLAPIGHGVIRGMLGEELADQLDVPRGAWPHLFDVIRAVVGRLEASPLRAALRPRLVERGRAYWAMVSRGKSPIEFAPPEALLGIERLLAPT